MKFTSISKNKIIGFSLLLVLVSSLGAVIYLFISSNKSTQKPTLFDAKALVDLAPTPAPNPPPSSTDENSGLTKNEEVVRGDSPSQASNKAGLREFDAAPGAKTSPSVANAPSASSDTRSTPINPASQAADSKRVASSGPITLERWSGPTLGDLEKLRSENAMLAEQLKNAELKTKIAKEGGVPGLSGSTNPNAPSNPTGPASGGGPRVVMIAGGENNYRANITLPNGQSITAQIGTTVPGLGIVSAITPDAVIFGSGKNKRSIPLVTNGANAESIIN